MEKVALDRKREEMAFMAVAGGLYVALGALQLVAGLGLGGRWSELMLLGGGAIDGAVLVLVGLVFVEGLRELRRGEGEGVGFLYIGIVLGLFFLGLRLAEMAAQSLGALVVGGDDYSGYSPLDSVSPALYVAPLLLFGLWRWRAGFTLVPRGPVGANGAAVISEEGG